MNKKYRLITHGDGFTVEQKYDTYIDAEVAAFMLISKGTKDGNRIYPNHMIRYCEIVEVDE